jgi:hypothetical protein
MNSELSVKEIGQRIYFIRGHRVMLDSDLAELYEVETKNLNKAVARNSGRFPDDFMFQINEKEYENLRFQFGTSRAQWGGRRTLPYVFTQEGVAMLSGVLHSERAIQVNVAIMRTFVQLRKILESNNELVKKLEQIERKLLRHDHDFKSVFEAIRLLMATGSPVTQKKIKPMGEK